MINILLGAPGGGKSYEAVVFHVLPALKSGRKVVTNLPLQKEGFDRIDPGLWSLVELRTKSLKQGVEGRSARAFSQVEDFADEWRGAEGHGPLYVVDECHLAMPKKETPIEVEEWFSMHRHYNADVLLITQSAGKLNTDIADMVQTAYKVRKATILGDESKYLRKVTDGIRGPIIDDDKREYKPQFFPLYKSHTKGKSVGEIAAGDVRSKYKRFNRMSWAVIAFGLVMLVVVLGNKMRPKDEKPKPVATRPAKAPAVVAPAKPVESPTVAPAAHDGPVAVPAKLESAQPAESVEVVPKEKPLPNPFDQRGVHLAGCMHKIESGEEVCSLMISQNGSPVFSITNVELEAAGFTFTKLGDCIGMLAWAGEQRAVICDTPQVQMGVAGARSVGVKSSM